jgi:hypothetical protein
MSRNIDSTLAAGLANANIQPFILAALTFKSGTVWVWSGVGSLTWGGNTYLGVGSLGTISAISEGTSVQADGMTVTLSGIPLQQGIPVYIPATAAPWSPGLTGNSAYNYGYIPGPQPYGSTPPVVVPLSLGEGESITITAYGSVTPNSNGIPLGPGDTAVGPAGAYTDANGWPGGPYGGEVWGDDALTCVSGASASGPIATGGLMGAFTDSGGVVVEPVAIGNGATLTVPSGATQLQLGINDNAYIYNTGGFTATVAIAGSIPISSSLMNEVLTDVQIGAAAQIYFGLMSSGAIVGTPYLAFSGTVDKPTVKVGTDTMTISLALENRLVNLQRANQRRYTSADQRLYYPTDTGFNWVETLNDRALRWG